MLHQFPFFLVLIVFIILLIMLAQKIKVAYPIVLVVGGLILGFIPSIPNIEINPELIFLIFLPPLLYEAAWFTSWKEFWRLRRVIFSFAFLIVIVTSFVVAWVASSYIPGFTMALGFLLGAIVSPPDAVSAQAILKFVKVPRVLSTIIEGESLLNDASSLIVFRFALIAVDTGRFVFSDAALDFVWVIGAGTTIGLAVAYIFYLIHRLLPTDVNMNIALTLVAPYAMYIAAESIHVSGVLAVVSGGLFLSIRQHKILDNSSRLRGIGVWSALSFVLNGLVFMLIGLELPIIVQGLEGVSLSQAIGYGCLITGVLIVARVISALFASVFTTFISRFITTADSHPGFKGPFIFGWAGMRGVVSLAAALSIPAIVNSTKQPFPHRNLILFITFMVILLTLLIQGLSMPWLIRVMKLTDRSRKMPEEEENRDIHRRLARESLSYLKQNFSQELHSHPALAQLATTWENKEKMIDDPTTHHGYKKIYLNLLEQQRIWLREWNKDLFTDEELIRKHLMRIDLEEERMKYS